MRIERVDLKAFGRFTDTSLDLSAGPNRFHIIYGPNESGKSTSLRAILAWLFGMPPRSTDNYLHSYQNLRVGGRLASEQVGVLECVRRKGKAKTLLTLDESEPIDPADLAALLGGMDEESFMRGFGLDRERLVAGGKAIVEGQGDMGEILFAAGVGMNHLREVQSGLDRELRELFLPSGSKPALNQTLAQLNTLRTQLRAATLPTNEYKKRCAELDEARARSAQIGERLVAMRTQLSSAERLLEAVPLVRTRQSLSSELEPLCEVPLLDEDFVTRRRGAESDLRLARVEHAQLKDRAAKLQERLAALPSDDALTPFTPRIESLARQIGAREEAREHLRGLEKRRDQADAEIAELLRRLGRPATEELGTSGDRDASGDLESLRIPDATRDRIWRLTDEGTRLAQQVDSDAARLAAGRRNLELAEQHLKSLEQPADSTQLDAVLRRVGNPQRLMEELRDAEEAAADLSARADAALRRLSGFDGSVADAVRLRPPLEPAVHRVGATLGDAVAEHERLVAERDKLQRDRSRISRELDGLRHQHAIPSEAELATARSQRDQQLDSLATAKTPSAEQVDALRGAIHAADRIVDRMRQEAERVAQRARAESQLATLEHEATELQQRLDEADSARQAAWDQWTTLWRDAGIEAGWPEEMRHWLDTHQTVVAAAQDADAAARRVASLADDHQTLCDALVQAIETAGGEVPAAAQADGQLVVLCHATEQLRDTLAKQHEEYAAAKKEVARLRGDTSRVAAELGETEQRLSHWKAAWGAAVEPVGAAADASPDEVRHRVGRIDEIFEKKRERDQHQRRIDGIQRDNEAFANQVAGLLADTAPILDAAELAEMSPHQAVDWLHRRLLQFQTTARERTTLTEQWEENERQMQQAERATMRCEAILRELCREVGCASADQLPEIERRSAERRRIETELRRTESQLERLAAGRPIDELAAEAAACDPDQLNADIEQLRIDAQSLDSQHGDLREHVGALRQNVEAMDGSSQAAEIDQQIQDLTARAARQARTYAQLRIAWLALGRAIEHYRQKNQGPILSRAEEIFSRLTCGDYHALRPQFDEKGTPILVGIRSADDAAVPANCLSEGTADALFLALRLASLEAHLERRGPLPLIVDDILVQFDDDRCAAALEVLAELGRKTQVVFFTHHRHLLELAEENLTADDYHVHQL